MPEQIRLKVGGVTAQQMSVYDEFSRCIPGFMPTGGVAGLAGPQPGIMGPAGSTASGGLDQSVMSDMNAAQGAAMSGHPGMPFMPKQPHLVRITSIVAVLCTPAFVGLVLFWMYFMDYKTTI